MSCLAAQPIVNGLEHDLRGAASFLKVDVTTAQGREMLRRYGLAVVPSIVVLQRNGEPVYRANGIPDPGAAGEVGGITWIELSGDAARLEEWLDHAKLPVRVVPGPPAVRAMGIGDATLASR